MFKSIQACRGIAALQVVLFHLGGILAAQKYYAAPLFARAFIFGDSGVEFFFVLSGFIITWVHRHDFGHPNALPRFITKRAIRIYPTYWLVFLSVFLLACVNTTTRAGLPWNPAVLIRSLLLVPQDPTAVGGTGAPVLVVAWSLQYEMAFYVFFASAIVNRGLAFALATLVVGNFIWCMHGCRFPQSFFSSNLLALFALGAVAAWLSEGRLVLRKPLTLAIVAACAYCLLVACDIVTEKPGYAIDRSLAYGLVFATLILALTQSEQRGRIFGAWRSLQVLGDSSYALYLIHFPLFSAVVKLMLAAGLRGSFGATTAFIIMLVSSVALSVTFHQWIETPTLRLLSSFKSHTAVARDIR